MTVPLKSSGGRKLTVPFPLSVMVPPAVLVHDEVRTVLSTSVATVTVTDVSSGVLAVPLTATGGSFTAATVMVTVAFDVAVPSDAEYTKESVPDQLAAGV